MMWTVVQVFFISLEAVDLYDMVWTVEQVFFLLKKLIDCRAENFSLWKEQIHFTWLGLQWGFFICLEAAVLYDTVWTVVQVFYVFESGCFIWHGVDCIADFFSSFEEADWLKRRGL